MLEIPSPRRPALLLAVVIAAQVLLLAIQIKRERNLRLVRVWTVELFTPLQRAGTLAIDKARHGWSSYIGLRHAREENDQLHAQVAELELRIQDLESRAAEADRLTVLLGFRQMHPNAPMLPARVIGASPVATSNTLYINRGEKSGVRRNMGVITPDGVVGKILEAYPDTSQVLLMTDRESGIGALLADSRTQGVVKGTNAPMPMLEYVLNGENVPVGERILTSGMDRIFPKDLPIGTVASAHPGNPLQVIQVRPAAHLERLEEVLVLLTTQPFEAQKEVIETAARPAKPATPMAKSPTLAAKPAAQPTKPVAQPAKAATELAKPTTQPAKATKPASAIAQPAKPATSPAKPMEQPAVPATQPAESTAQPNQPPAEPTKPTTQPEPPTAQPANPPAQPAKPAAQQPKAKEQPEKSKEPPETKPPEKPTPPAD